VKAYGVGFFRNPLQGNLISDTMGSKYGVFVGPCSVAVKFCGHDFNLVRAKLAARDGDDFARDRLGIQEQLNGNPCIGEDPKRA